MPEQPAVDDQVPDACVPVPSNAPVIVKVPRPPPERSIEIVNCPWVIGHGLVVVTLIPPLTDALPHEKLAKLKSTSVMPVRLAFSFNTKLPNCDAPALNEET